LSWVPRQLRMRSRSISDQRSLSHFRPRSTTSDSPGSEAGTHWPKMAFGPSLQSCSRACASAMESRPPFVCDAPKHDRLLGTDPTPPRLGWPAIDFMHRACQAGTIGVAMFFCRKAQRRPQHHDEAVGSGGASWQPFGVPADDVVVLKLAHHLAAVLTFNSAAKVVVVPARGIRRAL
jgi:hypothetical protein